MATIFPVSASVGQEFNGYRFDGTSWNIIGIDLTQDYVVTTDSRLSNARTPTAHASSHASAGSDPITLAQSQVTSLVTDLAAKVPISGNYALWSLPLIAGSNYWAPQNPAANFAMYEAEETALFIVPMRSCTIDRIAINIVTTAGSSGAVIRLGMRSFDTSTGLPGNLLVDGGTVDATSTGLKEVTVSQAVVAGTPYVLTATCQGGATTKPTVVGSGSLTGPWPNTSTYPYGAEVYKSSVTGALNNTGTWRGPSSANCPRIFVRTST